LLKLYSKDIYTGKSSKIEPDLDYPRRIGLKRIGYFYLLVLAILMISGCQGVVETEIITDTPATEDTLATDQIPSTPTALPPVGVLLTPEGSAPNLAAELNPIIGDNIRELGLRYQVLADLTAVDFQRDDYSIVVVIPPYPDISELAQNTPDTKFLAIGFNDLEPGENLSVLRSGGGDYDIQGFIAGYIAAMITTDWRVGVISVQENEKALAAREGFRVGVKYYCGLCNPKYAPTGINYIYPKYIDLPVDANDLQVNANIDFLVDRAVNTFYIVPGVGSENIYRTLVGYQKLIIGSGSDYNEEYKDYWVVSLDYDLIESLFEIWPEFLVAEEGIVKTPPLLLNDINYDLLSEGKLILVEKVLKDVTDGFIKTSFVE
jgi:hypothetical protein